MTTADLKLIDEAIQKYGDDWWNDPESDDGGDHPNRNWVIIELIDLLGKDNLDLKVIRKK